METPSSYSEILQKIDGFTRKYYRNQLIKGTLLTLTALGASWLCLVFAEFLGQFEPGVRTVMVYGFLLLAFFFLIRHVAVPLLKLYRIGAIISHEQAAKIIGSHFPEISDKLLNTLQLKQQQMELADSALLSASIDQKAKSMRPLSFTRAIDLKKNLKYARYAIIPLTVMGILMVVSPAMITGPTKRLIQYNTYFEKEAPFQFLPDQKGYRVVQGADLTIGLQLDGTLQPDEVFVTLNDREYRMISDKPGHFIYQIKNVQKSAEIRFVAGEFRSKPVDLEVIPKPRILQFQVALNYPAYLGKKDEALQNVGDLTIPAGTQVSWRFATGNVQSLSIHLSQQTIQAIAGTGVFTAKKQFLQSDSYTLLPANEFMKGSDSITYHVQVIPDTYPSLQVEQKVDSLDEKLFYFNGLAADDYGLTRLAFHYRFIRSENEQKTKVPSIAQWIKLTPGKNQQVFYHYFDLKPLNIEPSDEIEYYFEVWDNDGVTGPKSTKSSTYTFKAASKEELKQNEKEKGKEIESSLQSALMQSKQVEKQIQKLEEKLSNKKSLDWEDKKQLQDLMQKQLQLQQQIQQLQQQKNQKDQLQEQLQDPQTQEMLDKQEQLQNLFDKVMTEEMKKMLQEYQELLQKDQKDKIMEELNKMKLEDKEVQKELDRMLEMYKKLDLEQRTDQQMEKLKELGDRQEKLAEKTLDKNQSLEEIKKEQDQINKEFDQVQKELEQIEKENKVLENPMDQPDTKEDQQQIDQDQQKGSDQLNQQNRKGASKNQKSAGQKMKEMAEKMQQKKQEQEQEQTEEDYNALRQILDNLVQLSFDQEDLMNELKTVNGYNPKYVQLGQRQKKIKDDAKIIEDSLTALSKRVLEISPIVNREIGLINSNMQKTLTDLALRNINGARGKQQFVMTSLNNLALLLSDALKQMQQKMQQQEQNQKSGGGTCKKPGGKNPSGKSGKGKKSGGSGSGFDDLKGMQDQLGKMLQQMKNGKPTSKEFAQAAALQAAIRQKLKEMAQQFNQNGQPGLGKQLDQIGKMMDQTEKELYNKQLNSETLKRQQDITVRLLDSEKSQKEQEQEPKRESQQGVDPVMNTPKGFDEFKQKKQRENEVLRTVPPGMKLFYQEKVKQYFDRLDH